MPTPSQLDPPGRVLQITPLEQQALQLLANDRTPTEAAIDLGISTIAIEMLLARLFAAMGAATQTEAIAAAHRRGLLTQEPCGSRQLLASSAAPCA